MDKNSRKLVYIRVMLVCMGAALLYFDSALARSFSINIPNWLGTNNFETVAMNIIAVLRNFVAGIAILMLIIAGIMYIFSQGDQQRTGTAKKIMAGAITGLVIILAAETILRELYIIFGGTGGAVPPAGGRLFEIVQRSLSLLLSVLGAIGIIAFVWSAFLYLTSAGNEDQAEQGKRQMQYSIIGLVIAIGAMVIVRQISELLS